MTEPKNTRILAGNDCTSGRGPVPYHLNNAFNCVRAVVFYDKELKIAALTGTGFLIKLFGEIFFVSAKHVVIRPHFNVDDLQIHYTPALPLPMPISKMLSFSSKDDDTDHVDIVVFRMDAEQIDLTRLQEFPPFDITNHPIAEQYVPGMPLSFYGYSSDQSVFEYDPPSYHLEFFGGDLVYVEPGKMRATHVARATVNPDCPDFDGLSGSPVFHVAARLGLGSDSRVQFAGMALRASRKNRIFRFLDAAAIRRYLLGYFLDDLPNDVVRRQTLNELVLKHCT